LLLIGFLLGTKSAKGNPVSVGSLGNYSPIKKWRDSAVKRNFSEGPRVVFRKISEVRL
jgi:hypothetical protein